MTILPFPLWPLAEHIEFGQNTFDGSIGSGVLFCISTSCQRPLIFSTPPPLHRLVGFYQKLLTGFDAPVLYCMYLDKPMRDHVLLQAIARVNRPYEDED